MGKQAARGAPGKKPGTQKVDVTVKVASEVAPKATPEVAPEVAPKEALEIAPEVAPKEAQDVSEEVAEDVETEVCGVFFTVAAEDILASREYDDRVVIVTVDGRKIEGAKAQ